MTLRSEIIQGDCLDVLASMPPGSVQCVVTSPPYWGLRDYGVAEQLGLEATPGEYLEKMVAVFREVKRVLRDDGTLWLNMGDGYAGNSAGGTQGQAGGRADRTFTAERCMPKGGMGLKPKDLVGMPWRLALALQADGWYLRSDIIWSKSNPMPESCTDRPTKAHEYVFLLTKRSTYFWDAEAVREDGPTYTRKAGGYAGRQAGRDGALYDEKCTFATKDVTTTGRNIRTVWEIEAGPEPLLGWLAENHPAVLMEMLGEANAGRLTDTWKIATQAYPDAHFATFPEKLVEPCIRAGTSERGACPECGAGWVRVIEKVRCATRPGKESKIRVPTGWASNGNHTAVAWNRPREEVGNRDPGRHITKTTTTGWRPECECYDDRYRTDFPQARSLRKRHQHGDVTGQWFKRARRRPGRNGWEVRPTIILDPFAGSGTAGVVCARENRAFVGIELNLEYAKMAEERIGKVMRVAEDNRRQGTFAYGENPLDSPPAGGL